MPVDAEKNKLQNCYLGFSKYWIVFGNLEIFNSLFYFYKTKSPNFKIFKNPEYMY